MVRRAAPVRTCVGCRSRAPAAELLRVVAVERTTVRDVAGPPGRETGAARYSVVPDPAHRLPGRGAHLHPNLACLATAARRQAFGRALRISGVVDIGELAEFVTAVTGSAAAPPHSAQPMVGLPHPETQGRTINMSTR